MMTPPTLKQKAVLDFVTAHLDAHGIGPTIAAIAQHMAISKPTAYEHMQALQAKGWMVNTGVHKQGCKERK